MIYRKMGRTGLKLSALSLGSWVTFKNQVDVKSAQAMMSLAYENGVNFFDNAEVYAAGESERIMGEAIKALAWSRDSYTVSSKVFWGGPKPTQRGLSRKHINDACHGAMKRLQVDYLDLFFCHRPDLDTPVEETVHAMNDLIRQGKILYWGTSEWEAQRITEAWQVAKDYKLIGPSVEQPEYNLFHRQKVEADFKPIYESYGLGLTVWSPLASGILTGKYSNGIPSDSRMALPEMMFLREKLESPEGQQYIESVKELEKIAKQIGTNVTTMSLAWCARNPNVSTVILGASKPEQLKENLKAIDVIDLLTPEVMKAIEEVVKSKPEEAQVF